MKTKTFLLICFFLGIGMARLSAQTDAYKWHDVKSMFPISCDGDNWDLLTGSGTLTWLIHYKDDRPVWVKAEFHCNYTSSLTEEVFKGRELDPGIYIYDQDGNWLKETGTCHVILIGNLGSHYNITLSYYFLGEFDPAGNPIFYFSLLEAKCH